MSHRYINPRTSISSRSPSSGSMDQFNRALRSIGGFTSGPRGAQDRVVPSAVRGCHGFHTAAAGGDIQLGAGMRGDGAEPRNQSPLRSADREMTDQVPGFDCSSHSPRIEIRIHSMFFGDNVRTGGHLQTGLLERGTEGRTFSQVAWPNTSSSTMFFANRIGGEFNAFRLALLNGLPEAMSQAASPWWS